MALAILLTSGIIVRVLLYSHFRVIFVTINLVKCRFANQLLQQCAKVFLGGLL